MMLDHYQQTKNLLVSLLPAEARLLLSHAREPGRCHAGGGGRTRPPPRERPKSWTDDRPSRSTSGHPPPGPSASTSHARSIPHEGSSRQRFHQGAQPRRTSRSRCPAPVRSSSRSRRRACATPTSTRRTGTGRSSRPCRSSPGTRVSGSSSRSGRASTTPKVGDRVAMPWLGAACGVCDYCVDGWETLCEKQVNTGYGEDGSYAEYATANAAYVAQVPDAVDPLDAVRADVRRSDDVQGGQALRRAPRLTGGDLRHRRARPSRAAVREDQRRHRGRGRHQRREARAGQGTRRRPRRQRPDRGPGRGDQGARRSARGDLRRGRAEGLRAGVRRPCAAAAPWSSSRYRPTTSSSCRSSRPC